MKRLGFRSFDMALIDIENVHKVYELGKTYVKALRGIDLQIEKGDFLCIMGPSGSGKSTLLNLIGCLDNPTEGIIKFDGADISNLNDQEATVLRKKKIGFIFQSFNLIPVLNIYENVEFPLLLIGTEKSRREKMINELVEEVGLKEFIHHKPDELSGGQRQRVAIARALVTNCEVVLADEPTANLDHDTGNMIIDIMLKMNKKYGTTFIFSTHDPKIVQHAQKRVKIEDGKIVNVE